MKIIPLQKPIYSITKANRKQALPTLNADSYTPSFSSTRLYGVKGQKRQCENSTSPAYFSILSNFDSEDNVAISSIFKSISDGDMYARRICERFMEQHPEETNFFAIESDEDKISLKDRIITLAQADIYNLPEKKYLDIKLMQAMGKLPFSRHEGTKGSGELCLYGFVRLAKERNLDYVTLKSSNNLFYDHIQFGEKSNGPGLTVYTLSKSSYDDFLKRVETKYQIQKEE